MQIRLPLRLSLLLSLIFCLCCYIGAALLTPKIESLLPPERFPTFDRVDKPASPQDLFSDIATDVVPEVEKFFYDSNQEAILKRVGTNVLPQTSNSTCVDTIHSWLMTKLNTSLANTFNNYGDIQTDPSLVQRALVLTTLDKNSLVKSVLSDYLRGHVSVYQMINKTRECVGQNRYIAAWACDLIDDERLQLSFFDNLQETWRLNFHLWVLIEVINAKCLEDSRFWYEIMEHYVKITWAAVLESLESPPRPARVDENLEFVLQKVNSIFFLMKTQLAIRDHRYRPQVFLKMLWLNILEAAHVDKEAGVFDDNTMTALLLNYNANDHYVFLNQKVDWAVSKEWVDLYISWNLAYIERFGRLSAFSPLSVPSIMCSGNRDQGKDFLVGRVMTLAMRLSAVLGGKSQDHWVLANESFPINTRLMRHQGSLHIEGSPLPVPAQSDELFEYMFKTLCPTCNQNSWSFSNTGPLSRLSDDEFEIYVQLIVTVTMIMTGLGLEVQIGTRLLAYLRLQQRPWTWRLAQFLFAFFTTIAIVSRSVFGLPFLVIGLWKLGFPETIAYLMHAEDAAKLKLYKKAVADVTNSIGLMLHHSASAYVTVGLSLGYWVLDRELASVLLTLVVQHWFVLFKYYSTVFYITMELVIELWFEWEWFASFEHCLFESHRRYDRFAPAVAMCMIFAHWLFLLSGLMELIQPCHRGSKSFHKRSSVSNLVCTIDNLPHVGTPRSILKAKGDNASASADATANRRASPLHSQRAEDKKEAWIATKPDSHDPHPFRASLRSLSNSQRPSARANVGTTERISADTATRRSTNATNATTAGPHIIQAVLLQDVRSPIQSPPSDGGQCIPLTSTPAGDDPAAQHWGRKRIEKIPTCDRHLEINYREARIHIRGASVEGDNAHPHRSSLGLLASGEAENPIKNPVHVQHGLERCEPQTQPNPHSTRRLFLPTSTRQTIESPVRFGELTPPHLQDRDASMPSPVLKGRMSRIGVDR